MKFVETKLGDLYALPETREEAMLLLTTLDILNNDQWLAVKQFPGLFNKTYTVVGVNGGGAEGRDLRHKFDPKSGRS